MSLKINGRNIQSLPLRFRGAVGFEYAETNKGSQRNIFASEGIIDDRSGNPAGHLYPSAWIWPQKSGSITSFKSILGASDLIGSLALGLNAVSPISGTSSLAVTGFVTANLVASISGSGNIITAAAAITLNASANISGDSTVTAALSGPALIASTINNNVGTIYGVPFANGVLSASITPFTDLSPQNLAQAVWQASTTTYQTTSGTMGKELITKLKKTDFIALKD